MNKGASLINYKGKSVIIIALMSAALTLSAGTYLISLLEAEGLEKSTGTQLELIAKLGNYELDKPRWILSVAFSPNGKYALSAGAVPGEGHLEGGTIKLWDISNTTEIWEFKGHTRRVNSVAFSPDGSRALSASTDDTVRLWDVASGSEIRTLKKVQAQHPIAFSAVFSPDGKQVAVGTSENPSIRLLDATTGEEVKTFNEEFSTQVVVFSPDGKSLLSVSTYELPKLWDVTSGRKIRAFNIQHNFLQYLFNFKGAWTNGTFSPDGKLVVVSNSDGTIRLWDAMTGKEVQTFRGHGDHVTSVAFSRDGKYILSGSKDMTLRLWEVATGEEVDHISLAADKDTVLTIASSSTDNLFLAGTERGIILFLAIKSSPPI